jgi:methylmalonyl-CoA/ethylmalonyl-CoA epimerase
VFRVTDLKVVGIATADPDGAATAFRKNFGFPIVRTAENAAASTRSTFLAIGGAEIEMTAATREGSALAGFLAERGVGLHHLVLEVDDLAAARAELAARGIEASAKAGGEGGAAVLLNPTHTHGVRIVLVER